MQKKLGLISLALFITSCNQGIDFTTLSGNSDFADYGRNMRVIESNNILLHNTSIYPDVVDYAYNKDFIIAKQVPQKSSAADFLGDNLYTKYTSYQYYVIDSASSTKKSDIVLRNKIKSDSNNYYLFKKYGLSDKNSGTDIQKRKQIADSLIANDEYYKSIFSHDTNYWIINNQKDTLIGPLTREEYFLKRSELKIPNTLQLQ